ncbi:PGR5-like protein 1B, chloroplastic isoform X2 [Herrania umbratica]|uniref:PGR5-like protein 1B, chloroplastic isoform X2 n=1 Tax=Herrania umbratica TaxID=108875 RepID=A0A6J0ZUW0_9ROSI|nr:PGR5-like protein 1B, chloroplastic isoform X2 [Herrania umbratica]
MAGTCHSIRPHVIGSTGKLPSSTTSRTKPPFSVRVSGFSAKSQGLPTAKDEAPSCIFVGPIETASQETLEALYRQARDSYYSGEPLIVDDMFDRVELKLRWYGSKSVVKYPRCSIRRHSTYADAEEDISQVLALASIWILILAVGSTFCLVPLIYTISLAYRDPFSSDFSYGSQASNFEYLATVNGILFVAIGSVIGYSLASAAVRVLQRLWRKDLVALKGACPNCGEEQSVSRVGRRWVYGRVYLVSRRGRNRRWM